MSPTAAAELTELQRVLDHSSPLSGESLRAVLQNQFTVKDGRLEGLVILPKRLGHPQFNIRKEDLVRHIPDLDKETIKRLLMYISMNTHSRVNGSVSDDAYQHFAVTLGERLPSGLYAISRLNASQGGYVPIKHSQTRDFPDLLRKK
jgi:hypothetical protein